LPLCRCGEKAWEKLAGPSKYHFLKVWPTSKALFADTEFKRGERLITEGPFEGFVVNGFDGGLLRSFDGGRSWEDVPNVGASFVDDLWESPSGSLYLLSRGSPFLIPGTWEGSASLMKILTSQDGGDTWSELPRPENMFLEAFGGRSDKDVYLIARSKDEASQVMRSRDGLTWHTSSLPDARFYDSPSLLWVEAGGVAYLVGDNSILKTSDAGETWQRVREWGALNVAGNEAMVAVWGSSADFYAVGNYTSQSTPGILYPLRFHTRNSGATWEIRTEAVPGDSHPFTFVWGYKQETYLTDQGGDVLWSFDGGTSWQEEHLSDGPLVSLWGDEERVFVVADDGSIYSRCHLQHASDE
jgi:photosystem II stability/assembly factor-like uncharacterized protein